MTHFLEKYFEFNLIQFIPKPNDKPKLSFWPQDSFEISFTEKDFSTQTPLLALKKLNIISLNMSNIKNFRKPLFFDKKNENTYICHMQTISPITNQSALSLFYSPELIVQLIEVIIKVEEELLLNNIQDPYDHFSIGVINSEWVIDLFPKKAAHSLANIIKDIYLKLGKDIEPHIQKLVNEIINSKMIKSRLRILDLVTLDERFFSREDDLVDRALGCMIGAVLGGYLGLPLKCYKPSQITNQMVDEILTLQEKQFRICQGMEMGFYLLFSLYERFNKYNQKFMQEGWDLTAKWYSTWYRKKKNNAGLAIKNALKKICDQKFDLEGKGWSKLCQDSSNALNQSSEGNGSIMRIIPLAILLSSDMEMDNEIMKKITDEDVCLTHSAEVIKDSTFLYCIAIKFLIQSGGDVSGMFKSMQNWINENHHDKINEWWKLIENNDPILEFKTEQVSWAKLTFMNIFIWLKKLTSYKTFTLDFAESFNKFLKWGGDTDTNASLFGGLLGAIKGANKLLNEVPNHIKKSMFSFEPKQPQKLSLCYGLQVIKYIYNNKVMINQPEKHNQKIRQRNNIELSMLHKRSFGGKTIIKSVIKNRTVKVFKKFNKKYTISAILPPPSFHPSSINQVAKEKFGITCTRFNYLNIHDITSGWKIMGLQACNYNTCNKTIICQKINEIYTESLLTIKFDEILEKKFSNIKYFLIPIIERLIHDKSVDTSEIILLYDDFGFLFFYVFGTIFKEVIHKSAIEKLQKNYLFPWAKCSALYKISIDSYSISKHIPFLLEMQKPFDSMNFEVIFGDQKQIFSEIDLGPFCGCLESYYDVTLSKLETILLNDELHLPLFVNMCKRFQLLYYLILYLLEGNCISTQLLLKIESCFNAIPEDEKCALNDILMIYAYILTLVRRNRQDFQLSNTLANITSFYNQTIYWSTITTLNHIKNYGIKDFSVDQLMLLEYNYMKILPDLIDDSWFPSAYSIQTSVVLEAMKKVGRDNGFQIHEKDIDIKKPLFTKYFPKRLDDEIVVNICKIISGENTPEDQKLILFNSLLKSPESNFNVIAIDNILFNFDKQNEQIGNMILYFLNKPQYFSILNKFKYYEMFVRNIISKKYIKESLYYLTSLVYYLNSSNENFDKIVNEVKKLEQSLELNQNFVDILSGISTIFANLSNKRISIDDKVIKKLCEIIHSFSKSQNQKDELDFKLVLDNLCRISENQLINLDFESFEILVQTLSTNLVKDQVFNILRHFVSKTNSLPKDFQMLLLKKFEEFEECLILFEEIAIKNMITEPDIVLGLFTFLNNTNHTENLGQICTILAKQKLFDESIHIQVLYEIQLFVSKYDDPDYLNDLIHIVGIIGSQTEIPEELECHIKDRIDLFSTEGKILVLRIIHSQLFNFNHFQSGLFELFQTIYDEDDQISQLILEIIDQYLILSKDNIEIEELEDFMYFLLEQKLNVEPECLKKILDLVSISFKFVKYQRSNLEICEKLQFLYQTHSNKTIRDLCYTILEKFDEIDENCTNYFKKFFNMEKAFNKWRRDDNLSELKQTIFVEDIKISMKFFEILEEKLQANFQINKTGYYNLINFLEEVIISSLKISLPLFLLKSILDQLIKIENDNDLIVQVIKSIIIKSIRANRFIELTEEILKSLEKLIYTKGLFLVEIFDIFIEYYKQNFTLDTFTIQSFLDYSLKHRDETIFNERLLEMISLCFEYTLSAITPEIFEKSIQFLKIMPITNDLKNIVYWLQKSVNKDSHLYPIYENHKDFLLTICPIQSNNTEFSEIAAKVHKLNKTHANTLIVNFLHNEQNDWVRNADRHISMKISENELSNCYSISDLKKIIKKIRTKILDIKKSNNINDFAIQWYTTTHSDLLMEILAIIQKALYILNKNSEKPKSLRLNQIYSVILMLNAQSTKGRIAQISTGEGKSLIIAVLAIIIALTGLYVFVATTYKGLAERDAKEMKPLFDIFQIKCMDNIDRDYKNGLKKCYHKDISVIYGTVDQFQFDILRHIFGFNGTMGNRDVQNFKDTYILIDEVDSMLIDEPHRMALLSDPPGGIWRRNILDVQICNLIKNSDFNLSPNGYPKLHNSIYLEAKYYLNECINGETKFIPKFLEEYTQRKLSIMVENSIHALLEYKNSVEYIVCEGNDKQLDIIPVDNTNTGAIEISKSLSDGLQQALRLKEGLKPRSDGIITNFLPNLTFFKTFENRILGFTGTLGSNEEKSMVEKVFNVDYVYIPRNKNGEFREYEPILETKKENWLKQIKKSCLSIISQGRCILLICGSLDEATSIEQVLKSENLLKYKIHKYTRDDKSDEIQNIKREMVQGDIMIATNLAGRGADIHVSNLVEEKGGLHVCLTFTPPNERVKLQAFGRTARKGCSGSAQMIICSDYFSLKDLELEQKVKEKLVLNEFVAKYAVEISKKSELFQKYCQKRKKFKARLEKEMEVDFALKDLDQYWGMFINTLESRNSSEIQQCLVKIDEKINFTTFYEYTNPFNLIEYANSLISSVRVFKKATYEKALSLYNRAISLDSDKLFGAYYKMAYLTICLQKDSGKSSYESYKQRSLEYLLKAKEILQKNVLPSIFMMGEAFETKESSYKNSYKAYFNNKMHAFEYLLDNIEQNIRELEFSLKKITIIQGDKTKTYFKHSDIETSIPNCIVDVKIYGFLNSRNDLSTNEAINLFKSIKQNCNQESKFFAGMEDINSERAIALIPFSKNMVTKHDGSKSNNALENIPISIIFTSQCSMFIKTLENLLKTDEFIKTPNMVILKTSQERICNILANDKIRDQSFEMRLYFNDINLLRNYLEFAKHENSFFFGIENIAKSRISSLVKIFKLTDVNIVNKKDIEENLKTSDTSINELQELKTEGIDFFFSLQQKKPVPWMFIISCSLFGLVQIGMLAYLCNIQAIGTSLISEGIGDLIFSILSLNNRDSSWKDYAIQKAISLSILVITGGFHVYKMRKAATLAENVSAGMVIGDQAAILSVGKIANKPNIFFNFTKQMIKKSYLKQIGASALIQGSRFALGIGIKKGASSLFRTQLQEARNKFALSIDNILEKVFSDEIITIGFRLDAIAQQLFHNKSNENELRFMKIGQDTCQRFLKTNRNLSVLNADYSSISTYAEFAKILINFILDAHTLNQFEVKFENNFYQSIQRFKLTFSFDHCIELINFLDSNSKNHLKVILSDLQIQDFNTIHQHICNNQSNLSKQIEHHFKKENAIKLKDYLFTLSTISTNNFIKEKGALKIQLKEVITESYFNYFENAVFRPAFSKYTNFLAAIKQKELDKKMARNISTLIGYDIIRNVCDLLEKKSLNSQLKQEALNILEQDIKSIGGTTGTTGNDDNDKICFAFKLHIFMEYLQYHNHFIKLYIEEKSFYAQEDIYNLDEKKTILSSLPLKFMGYEHSKLQIYLRQKETNWIVEKDDKKSSHNTIYQAFHQILKLITDENNTQIINLDIIKALKDFILEFKEYYSERYLISKKIFNGEEMDDDQVIDDPKKEIDTYLKVNQLTDLDILQIKCLAFFKQFNSVEILNMFKQFNIHQGKILDLHIAFLLYIVKMNGQKFSSLPYSNNSKVGIGLGLDLVEIDSILMKILYGEKKCEKMLRKWKNVEKKIEDEWIPIENQDLNGFKMLLEKYRLQYCISEKEFNLFNLSYDNFLIYFRQKTDLKIHIMIENFGYEYWNQSLRNETKVILLYLSFFGNVANDQLLKDYILNGDPIFKSKYEKLDFYKEYHSIETSIIYKKKLADMNNLSMENALESIHWY